jgi:hypothetical protein
MIDKAAFTGRVPAEHSRIGFAQRCTNAMAEKPACLFAQSEHATDLKGAHVSQSEKPGEVWQRSEQ